MFWFFQSFIFRKVETLFLERKVGESLLVVLRITMDYRVGGYESAALEPWKASLRETRQDESKRERTNINPGLKVAENITEKPRCNILKALTSE